MIGEYIKSYDPAIHAWRKRSDAEAFALFLAGELLLNPKGVQVDKDGKTYRVHIPLISVYWEAKDTDPATWHGALAELKQSRPTWLG